MSILEVRGVSFSYKGSAAGKCALKDIDLSFQDNMITGLIGHTGSGKSTLVQMFNGLLKPDSGQILLDGKDIWSDEVKIRDVRFRVGLSCNTRNTSFLQKQLRLISHTVPVIWVCPTMRSQMPS